MILSGIHAYYEPEELIGKTCIAITNLPPRKMMGIDSCGMLISAVHKEGEEEKLHLLMVDPPPILVFLISLVWAFDSAKSFTLHFFHC